MATIINNSKVSAANQVVEYVRTLVKKNKLGPGDALPTEKVIAEATGVSRGSVREGLSQLRVLCFIDSKTRTGPYVAERDPQKILAEILPSLARTETEMHELGEFRTVVECGAAALAATERTQVDLDEFVVILAEEKEAMDARDYEVFCEMDKRFHMRILKASHNALLEAMCQVINIHMSELPDTCRYPNGHAKMMAESHLEHEQLLLAIRSKDASATNILMRLHTAIQRVEESIPSNSNH